MLGHQHFCSALFFTLYLTHLLCNICVCVSVPYSDKVQGLCYASHTRQLISGSSDGGIVIWNMDVTRQEVKEEEEECNINPTHKHIYTQLMICSTL